MSFESPWLLLAAGAAAGLARLPGTRAGAERAPAAFASPALLASVAPRRPGWRRHAPYALYGLALAGLALALARPQATVAVPHERASVVLATDTSGSMQASDVPPSRLVAAREAGLDFLDEVPRRVRVGAVIFNHTVRSIERPPRTATGCGPRSTRCARAAARRPARRSPLAGARGHAGRRGRPAPAAIVLLSDGASTHGRDPLPVAQEAARPKVPVYTVALGTDAGTIEVQRRTAASSGPCRPTGSRCRLADTSGGRYSEADDRRS